MEETINNLYIGGDDLYLKLKDRKNYSFLRCCKEGPDGHRFLLGYTSQAAPKGDEYLAVRRKNLMALNFIDPHDPGFIPTKMVEAGVKFVQERVAAGDRVLVACNQGHSRGPTLAMLYMRSIGELPENFSRSENVFRILYPAYDPGPGMRQYAKQSWHIFNNWDGDKKDV